MKEKKGIYTGQIIKELVSKGVPRGLLSSTRVDGVALVVKDKGMGPSSGVHHVASGPAGERMLQRLQGVIPLSERITEGELPVGREGLRPAGGCKTKGFRGPGRYSGNKP